MIDRLKKAHPVRVLCQALALPRSSYYARRRAQGRSRAGTPEQLAIIRQTHRDTRGSYGARRMAEELSEHGHKVGRHRARTLMRQAQLPVVRRPPRYRPAGQPAVIAPNRLNRAFNPPAPNQAWAGDITYLPTREGWLYLAIVVDLYARRIVGAAFSTRADSCLVLNALEQAWQTRKAPAGLLFHSDQGCQYTSMSFVTALEQRGITQSMSRRGNCWDNAVVERVFRSLKHEWMSQEIHLTRRDAELDASLFIHSFYNHRRRHAALGQRSPAIVDALAA
jgi:putative transposase